nr:alcohol dehydrogenase [Aspergillus niger CBS 513.88]|eukprot:XP_001396801.2 alcohol dehydrogenase [Aspergillus niger CBS 513.88]
MATHLAALLPSKSSPFTLTTRPTPTPGPNELLIAVKSIALNPADTIMRDTGLFIPSYPTVLGFDLSGLVLEVGTNVPIHFRTGITRVAAYSASVWKACDPDYGAFQERCLVPWQHVMPLPDEGVMSWNEAATLPVAVQVALNAWESVGVMLRAGDTQNNDKTKSQNVKKREVLLVWGASSSVGSMGVQVARVLRDQPGSSFAAVYATAGTANHEYIQSLGADRVFDYGDPSVVDEIVEAARKDGSVIRYCFLAVGDVRMCQGVLGAFVGFDGDEKVKGKIASAPVIPADMKGADGVEVIFVVPSMDDEGKRPSPELRVVGRGLQALNDGLDELGRGVSCTKLVVEIAE